MTKIVENKDLNLKLMCKTLFKKMGYVTHYEVMVRNKSYVAMYKTHDISDIDVYGYRFNPDLSYSTIGSECKSGETNALEELFKFYGIINYFKIDSGYLIKSKIHQNAREVAVKNKMRCFSEAELRKMLLGFEIDVDKTLRIENAKYTKQVKLLKNFKTRNEKLVDYLTYDYWNKENWRNIHNLIHLLQIPLSTKLFNEGVISIDDKYVYYYTLELFSDCILKNIGDAIVLNYSDVEGAITTGLYGGAESLNERRRFHDLVNQVSQRDEPFDADWQSDLINMSARFAQNTKAAARVPDLIQSIYENAFYETKIKFDAKDFNKFSDLTRKFTQDLMQFTIKSCKLDPKVFEEFMAL